MSLPPVPPRPGPSPSPFYAAIPPPPPLPKPPGMPASAYPAYNPSSPQPHLPPNGPHFEAPMTAPKPVTVNPAIPADMARQLDEQVALESQLGTLPLPPPLPSVQVNEMPAFAFPTPQHNATGPIEAPQDGVWSPWGIATPQPPPLNQPPSQYPGSPHPFPSPPQPRMSGGQSQAIPNPHSSQNVSSMTDAMGGMNIGGPPPYPPAQSSPPANNASFAPALSSSPPPVEGSPLTAPLPNVSQLLDALSTVQKPSHPAAQKVAWCRDVLTLVERDQQLTSGQTSTSEIVVGPINITDTDIQKLAQVAVPLILSLASHTPVQGYVAEAVYWRATLASSGWFPNSVKHNPRSAFRDFEAAARGGYHTAWFRLGRDYENFNDATHAKECFERGIKYGVESCVYRLAMANLMGQLGLPANPATALPLLQRAATLASLQVPQPAYVYALLLLDEFSQITIPANLFAPLIPPGSSRELEARKHLERAAYLHFPAAQYKLGHCYEFAQPPFPFDALLSVQYYSLASQQGEVEADMALSKWFLCGSEDGAGGGFEKDEKLAFTFAEKAAKRGLPSAEFAMGYYKEVGVGGPRDLESATWWYKKASEHGNSDAAERLSALLQPTPQSLSRQEHVDITEVKLVRKRTQAKQRSDSVRRQDPQAQVAPPMPTSANVIEVIRKNSISGPQPWQKSPPQHVNRLPAMPEHPNPPHPQPQHHQTQPYPQQTQPPPQPHHQQSQPSPQPHRQQSQPQPLGPQGPQPRPPKQQQHFPQSQRYTLTDPGSNSSSPRPQQGRPGGSPPGGSPRPQAHPQASIPQGPKKPGPTTFAEMGFQGAKAEDKECIIM